LPKPADYGTREVQHDVYTLDPADAPLRSRSFDVPPTPNPRPAPTVASKPIKNESALQTDLPSSFYEANVESYLKARRVAEMKFNTIKLVLAFGIVSVGLVVVNLLLYPGIWWFYWPIGGTAFILAFPVTKCFVFRGRDIRSVIEN
jgi:hypothetical protein